MRTSLLLTLCLFLFAACNRQDASQDTAITTSQPSYDPSEWVKADLLCEELRNADENDPLAVVYLNLMETQQVLDTVYTCSVIAPQMYISYSIPREALSACGGWWQGQGRFFYTLHHGDSIEVMQAQPAQTDTLVFEYRLLGRFPVFTSPAGLPAQADSIP